MTTALRAARSSVSYPLVLSTDVCVLRPSRSTVNLITTVPGTSACCVQPLRMRSSISATYRGQQKSATSSVEPVPGPPPVDNPKPSPRPPVSTTSLPVRGSGPCVGGRPCASSGACFTGSAAVTLTGLAVFGSDISGVFAAGGRTASLLGTTASGGGLSLTGRHPTGDLRA